MSSVIPAPGVPPLPIDTEFVASNDRNVLFKGFAVGHSDLKPEHDAYIKNILVPFYINQIEALGFSEKTLTVRPLGEASATGNSQRNMTLSIERAAAIGAAVKKHFDAQKGLGNVARGVEVVVKPVGLGDARELAQFGPAIKKLPEKAVDDRSGAFRSVTLRLNIRLIPEPSDAVVLCRQLLDAKLKVTTVPANQLEQTIADIQAKMPPELKAALSQFFDAAKGLAKTVAEELLKAAEFSAPELFIIFKGIDFIIPSDIALLFEFKDSRGLTKQYIFSGSANKIDLSALEVFCQMLSLLKWMTKLPPALEEMEREVELAEKKLNMTHEQIEAIEKAISKAKKLSGNAKKIFDAITAPGSLFRKAFGDALTDRIIQAVNAGSTALFGAAEIATDFRPVAFASFGVFDIGSFAGAAQTETRELISTSTTVLLEFAAVKNQPLLGFQASVLLERKFSLGFTLTSFEISRGNLLPKA